jgi:hypothetical protein
MTDIPIGSIVIDVGNVPQWFIAIAAAAVVYKVWVSERHASDIVEKIEQVRFETSSMRSALELASKAEGRLQGRQEMREETVAAHEVAKETIRTDAIADAATHAAVRAADPDAAIVQPKPVAVVTVAVDTPKSTEAQ